MRSDGSVGAWTDRTARLIAGDCTWETADVWRRWRSVVPAACLIGGVVAEVLLHRSAGSGAAAPAGLRWVGPAVLVPGCALPAWTLWLLFRHRTTVEPSGTPTVLLRDGPFRFSRNPAYLGYLLILVGAGLLTPSWATVVAPLVFFTAVDRLVIPYEEGVLAAQFGETYLAYRSSVRRWLGRRHPSPPGE